MAHPGEPVRLRTGVIGLGYFGGRHARVYADHPAADLIAVSDIDGARVAELASATGATGYCSSRTTPPRRGASSRQSSATACG